MPYRQHLSCRSELLTLSDDIRAGFVALASERNRRATPFVEQARTLKVLAMRAKSPNDLLNIEGIQAALLTASGFSDKAATHVEETHKTNAIQGLIDNFLEPAGGKFVEELVYRYLLTRGDSLGGKMRNTAGQLAQQKLTRAIISALTLTKTAYQWLHSTSKTWINGTEHDVDIALNVKALSWQRDGKSRTMIYNLTVPLVKKT